MPGRLEHVVRQAIPVLQQGQSGFAAEIEKFRLFEYDLDHPRSIGILLQEHGRTIVGENRHVMENAVALGDPRGFADGGGVIQDVHQ